MLFDSALNIVLVIIMIDNMLHKAL